MFELTAAAISLFAVLLTMTSVWAVHLRDEDASIVDPVWGIAIWTAGLVYALGSGRALVDGRLVVLVLSGAWAARLASHLSVRHRIEGRDRRYETMRKKRGDAWWWQSLFVVFWLQAGLAWIVALPLFALSTGERSFGALGWIGVGLATAAFLFEAIADGQLARFKRDERAREDDERGVLDTGLWRYSRHPNYFGEAMFWCALGLAALGQGAWWALFGPAVITFLLLRVSGVTMTEESIGERRPEYAEYIRRTNAFLPGPPRSGTQ